MLRRNFFLVGAGVIIALMLVAGAVRLIFFKTGPGDYGEGDLFRGIKVPRVRAVASEFRDLPFPETKLLLASPFHEDRLAALDILVNRWGCADLANLSSTIFRP